MVIYGVHPNHPFFMKKNTLWAIVGLMAAALLGIIFLQSYWISNAIELKREQFDVDVKTSLNMVAKELQEKELEELNRMEELLTVSEQIKLDARSSFTKSKIDLSALGQNKEGLSGLTKDYQDFRRFKPQSLGDRIEPQALENLLSRELGTRNIDTEYDYEVYATFNGVPPELVISNGTYAIAAAATSEVTELPEEVKELSKEEYHVPLFDNAGKLVVSFPQRSRFILEKVFYPLIAAVFFTAIVLFCFVYTVQVILTQKKVSEMKTDFVNNMTHEFKTPIATISLAVDSIMSPMILSKEDKVKRFADIIKQENKRMLSQVEKVLQMALLDKKDFKLNLDYVDLHEVIEQAVVNSHLLAEKRGGYVIADLQASKSRIEGDVTHISNIIHNLLDNANKYSIETPEISVRTRDVPNGVEVVVKDNGIGLSKEARKNIFDKFYRVHTGNVHDVKGFGLGLAYVKTMMTAHKGQIDVKSELGKGSSFILTFPLQIRENVDG